MKRLIFINTLIFFFILITIESLIFVYRYIKNKEPIGYIKTGSLFNQIDDDCQRMKSHPILGHVHDHRGKCEIIGGKIFQDNFILYDSDQNNKNVIITLGGSTTDGFYKNFSKGKTYPYFLSKLCENQCVVINGGTGGYGSSKETLKLLTQVSNLDLEISHIISLSGINDIKNYSNQNYEDFLKMPFLDENQVFMLENQKWVIKNKKPFILFPNLMSIFYDLDMNLPRVKDHITKNEIQESTYTRFKNNTDTWLFNIKNMRAISQILNAEFKVFLQPTMGLEGIQSELTGLSGNDKKILSETLKDKEYIENLRTTYTVLKKHCQVINYCEDISDIAPPSSECNYSNNRHHNEKGNQIIAKKIFEKINF